MRLALILLLPFLLLSCQKPATKYQENLYAFGTTIQITIYHPYPEQINQAINELDAYFQKLHQQLHPWEKTSEIYQINLAIQQGKAIEISTEVKEIIQLTQDISQLTDYLFDPAIGSLIKAWGFHGETWQGPPLPSEEINKWLADRPSIKDIKIENSTLTNSNPKAQLDFGGNAVGYALIHTQEILKKYQIQNALINIGGDILALGNTPKGKWKIGIQNPKNPQEAIEIVELTDGEHLFTSGTYQRYYTWQDQEFSHLINPNTGYPADSLASATVISQDPLKADIAATALVIAGEENWQKIAKQLELGKVFIITRSGKTAWLEQTP